MAAQHAPLTRTRRKAQGSCQGRCRLPACQRHRPGCTTQGQSPPPCSTKCCQHGLLRHNPSTNLQATSRAVMPLAPRTQYLEAASLPGSQCVPSLQQRQLPSGPFAPEAVFRQLAKRMPLPQCTPRRANGAAQVNTSFQAGCPSILSGAYYGSSFMKAWPAAAHASQACPLQQLAAVQPAAKKQPKTI